MRTIYGSSSGIKTTVGLLHDLTGEMNWVYSDLGKCKSELSSYWIGDDATAFLKKLEKCMEQLKKFKKESEDYYEYLNLVSKTFDAIEDANNKSISVPKGGV